jgi:drug/metabolite transporter superfamily protein YnfA
MVNCEGESHFLIAMDIKGVYPVRAYFHNLKAARHVALAMAALTICAVTAALLKTAPAPRHPRLPHPAAPPGMPTAG